MTSTDKKEIPLEKPKRKRIAKPVVKKETPEKEKAVEEDIAEEKETKPKKIVEKKKIVIKPKEKVSEDEIDLDEYEDIEDGHEHLADPKTIAPALLELLKEEDSAVEEDLTMVPPSNGHQHHQKAFPQKKEPVFNIEFDGIILAEGVLEMMPDGYGFLRSSEE